MNDFFTETRKVSGAFTGTVTRSSAEEAKIPLGRRSGSPSASVCTAVVTKVAASATEN